MAKLPKSRDFPSKLHWYFWMAEHFLHRAEDSVRIGDQNGKHDLERVQKLRQWYEELIKDPEVQASLIERKGGIKHGATGPRITKTDDPKPQTSPKGQPGIPTAGPASSPTQPTPSGKGTPGTSGK